MMGSKQIVTLDNDEKIKCSIGRPLGTTHDTVNHYMQLIRAAEHPLAKLVRIDYDVLCRLFPPD